MTPSSELGAVVIVGTGHGGYQTAVSLRDLGFTGQIVLVGDEKVLPYQRPPLSKSYLAQGDSAELTWFREDAYFAQRGIEVQLGDPAVAIDRAAQRVALRSGREIAYDHLVLATGLAPRQLPLCAGLSGVHALRDQHEAEALRTAMSEAASPVLIGGGFIGLEVATSLAARGKPAVLIEQEERLLGRMLSPESSAFLLQQHRAMGLDVRLGESVASVEVRDDGTKSVITSSGWSVWADLLLVSVGGVPRVALAESAGVQVGNGIVVDDRLLTSDPNISAIGDIAEFPDPRSGRVRIESVQNAMGQARFVAARLTGARGSYDEIPWFWSDQAGIKVQIVGLPAAGAVETHRTEAAKGSGFSIWRFSDGELTGGESMDDPRGHLTIRRALAAGAPFRPADLAG